MNSDCSSYVIICLLYWGLPMTAFLGGANREGCAHTCRRKIKWNTGGKNYFCSFNFFFFLLYYFWLNQCIFILGDSDRQRGCTTSAVQCKEKKTKTLHLGEKFLRLPFAVFVFIPLFQN